MIVSRRPGATFGRRSASAPGDAPLSARDRQQARDLTAARLAADFAHDCNAQSNKGQPKRRNALRRALLGVLFDTDILTIEKVALSGVMALALGVMALGDGILVQPPPLIQSYTLALPSWLWTVLLFTGGGWQVFGAKAGAVCLRRNGSLATFVTLCALSGSLFVRGPVVGGCVTFLSFWQCVVAVRFWHLCQVKRADAKHKDLG